MLLSKDVSTKEEGNDEHETFTIQVDPWKKVVGIEICAKKILNTDYRTTFKFLCTDF